MVIQFDFNILHLNINSVINKGFELQKILNEANYDIVLISETKLTSSRPIKQFQNSKYNELFYNRPNNEFGLLGGGLLVYIKNGLKITKQKISSTLFEYIFIQVDIHGVLVNLILSYKPPNQKNELYLEELDNLIFSLDSNIPLFVIGDLNMESAINENFIEFLSNQSLINFMIEPTRTKTRFFKDKLLRKTKISNLDVILHNSNLIEDTLTIECPFSDHNFIAAKIKFSKVKAENKFIQGRNLSGKNICLIIEEISKINFLNVESISCIDTQWCTFKTEIQKILDKIAPIKEFKIKSKDMFPWFDDELLYITHCRDSAYKTFARDKQNGLNYALFYYWKHEFKRQYEQKMIKYFESKTMYDFKNSKKFWEFYSTHIKIKSDKTQKINFTNEISFNGTNADTIPKISELFNFFFTSIKSDSVTDHDDCSNFCDQFFDQLIDNGKIKANIFKFKPVSETDVVEQLDRLAESSGAGYDGIPTKILKCASQYITKLLCVIFNKCLSDGKIPDDFKIAVVTPLYKNKGAIDDINNYRGISVLSPIAKVFEKLLYKQIYAYFIQNKLI
ncbi:unnamed protein product, partial [Brachionus calyciflorus]